MANGLIQSLLTGIVPGNRNVDNVDTKLRPCDYLVYSTKSIQTSGLKAGMLKSFGFGQASAEVVIVHPDYLFAVLEQSQFDAYAVKRKQREAKSYVFEQGIFANKHKMVNVKDHAPYSDADETKVYLDPNARASYDPKLKTWSFKMSGQSIAAVPEKPEVKTVDKKDNAMPIPCVRPVTAAKSVEITMREVAEGLRQPNDKGIGVDVQLVKEVNVEDSNFVERNFTDAEIAYCKTDDPEVSRNRFAGRWAAKEAIIKAISSSIKDTEKTGPTWKGSGAALKGIEILPSETGAPRVKLYDHAADMAKVLGISEFKVTISHSGEYAVAQAVVR